MCNLKPLFVLFLICFGGFDAAFAQNPITMRDYLRGAQTQDNVALLKRKLNYLSNISHELPIVEKLEVRTETNQFDFKQQQYSLRVSPNSGKAIRAQRQYHDTNRHLAEMEVDKEFSQALQGRYQTLATYANYKKQLEILTAQNTLYSDLVTVLKKSISLPDFDIMHLIEAEDDRDAVARGILEIESMISTFEKDFDRLTGTEAALLIKPGQLLRIEQIDSIMKIKHEVELASHPDLKILSAEIYGSTMQYEWEATRTKFSVSYLQARYGYDPNENFSKGFTIGIGFDIPLRGAARLDLNKLQVQSYELESQYMNEKNLLHQQINKHSEHLNNLLAQFKLVTGQIKGSQAEHALKEYGKVAETSPRAMLQLRENTLKKELILLELELEIVHTFIDYLALSGKLTERPLRNYLSHDFEQF